MTGRVPGPTGKHGHHHGGSASEGAVMAHQGHANPRPDGVVLNMDAMTFVAPKREPLQSELTPCPSRALEVRYFYTFGHKPSCEVWKLGSRVYPPPYLIARADKTKDDSILREGDTLDGGSVREMDLPFLGFEEKGSNPLVALLFFIMDIGSSDDYRVVLTVHKILPELHSQWEGRVILMRSLVVDGTLLPFPRQSGYEENFKSLLALKDIVEPMLALAKIIEAFEGLLMDFLWGLTGAWEVKVAGEVTEKYVAREVMRRVIKYIRPKFIAIAKAYIEGFAKEMAKQVFRQIVNMIKMAASQKLFATAVPVEGAITVEGIHWLQSSKKLSDALDHSKMDWEKCHAKGMEEGLKPFWKLFADKRFATGAIRQFLNKCTEAIDQFFFRHGLLVVIQKAEGAISKQLNASIVELVDAIVAKAKPGKPVTDDEAQSLMAIMLGDGTLVDRVKKYFEENWEKLAKSALEKVEKEFIKAIRGAPA